MTAGLVSIIVPTFNREDLVLETLDSIREQTYQDLELLIIDDGSADGTVRTVQGWIDRHSGRFRSLRLFPNSVNRGKSAVVNQGFDLVTGEFVMVFDSDDILLPDAIENEVAFLRNHPEVGSLCAGAMLLSGSVRTGIQFHCMKEGPDSVDIVQSNGDLFLKGNVVISSSVLMRTEVMRATGYFNPQLRISHDWDYWIRISRKFRFGFLNIPVVYYRVNSDGSISQNKMKLFRDVLMVMELYAGGYSKGQIFRMMLEQIRGHLSLAVKDGSWEQFTRIALHGLVRLPGIVLRAA